MYRVHSTFYWVRSDQAAKINSPEKWNIIRQISIPARLVEIAKRVSRDESAVRRRLLELERLGLVVCKNSKWSAVPTSDRVMVPSH
jgi:predicted transcriptional regulator